MNFDDTPLFRRLLAASPFSQRELVLTIVTAPERYKDHFIAKRNGRGLRLISQPTAEVKHLQRVIVRDELEKLRIHDAAVGYRTGKSIRDHAAPHANARYLLKLDFKDFFPSLKLPTLLHCLHRDTNFSEAELWILGQLLCRRDRKSHDLQLSIGAPSSPFVSNYLMSEFDTVIYRSCLHRGVHYTRYADDLAFSTSTPRLLDEIYQDLLRSLASLRYLPLRLNDEKTVNVSKKNRRTLVGLNLANSGTVSIGREQKRILRATMHSFVSGILLPADVARLRGQLAFVHSVDPVFVEKLLSRYGFSRVNDVAHVRLVA